MTLINAKFASPCLACGRQIQAGERVSWIKGRRGVEHAACSAEGRDVAAQVTASRAEVSDLEVPAPAGLSYLPYQRAGIAYLAPRPGALLADEMGLGKTVQICGLINHLDANAGDPTLPGAPAHGHLTTALIICPKSLAINWQRELTKWLVEPRAVGRVGDAAGWEACGILIASYEQAKNPKFRPELEARGYDLVAVDEAHRIKNKTRALTKQQKAKAAEAEAATGVKAKKRTAVQRTEATLALLARGARKVLLTGTPFENRPVELFPLLQIADPLTWDPNGKGFFRFALRYCNAHKQRVSRDREVWNFGGSSNTAELQERLRASCMIRRLKAQVLTELPAKRRQIIELEIRDGEVTRAERELAGGRSFEEVAAELAGNAAAFESASKLRIAYGVAKATAAADYIKELIEGGSGKVIVGAWHRSVIEKLAADMFDLGVVTVTGADSAEHRQRAVDAFQAEGGPQVFIGQIAAAGVGLTLTRSNTVVMVEEPWTPAEVSQFEDRAHRIGQRDTVNVHHLVISNTLEAHMVRVIVGKQAVADAVLDAQPEPTPAPTCRCVGTVHGSDEDCPEFPGRQKAPAQLSPKQAELAAVAERLGPEHIAQIHRCMQLLAGRCDGARTLDGAGFSRIDLDLGHSLAAAPRLSPKQAALGLKLVRKYRGQLSGFDALDALLSVKGAG